MLYSILLMFIISCSQSSFVHHIVYGLRSITKPIKKNYTHYAQRSSYADNYPIQGAASYPLHTAVSNNELIKVKIILNEDKLKYKNSPYITVNQRDNEGYLAIHWAMSKKFSYKTGKEADNNLKILKLLLKYPNSSQGDKQGMTALHWGSKNNIPNSVKLILEKYGNKLPDFINQKDQSGLTALHYAVDKDEKKEYRKKRLQILNTLLNHPKIRITERDQEGKTALHWAVINNNLEAVKAILEHCSNKAQDCINQKDQETFTALHYAVDKDEKEQYSQTHLQILNALLNHPNIDDRARDKDGKTVLHWAVQNNNLTALKEILKYAQSKFKSYKDFVNLKTHVHQESHEGACPAIYWTTSPACSEENEQGSRAISLETFKLLLPKWEINNKDNHGNTIAHWIVMRGRNDMLKLLIEHKIDLNATNEKNQTALHAMVAAMDYAMTNRDFALMQYLYCKQDSILNQLLSLAPSRIRFNKKDQSGYTPLALAFRLKLPKEVRQKLKEREEKELPFKKRAQFKGANENLTN